MRVGDCLFAWQNQVGLVAVGSVRYDWDGCSHRGESELYPAAEEVFKIGVAWTACLPPLPFSVVEESGLTIVIGALRAVPESIGRALTRIIDQQGTATSILREAHMALNVPLNQIFHGPPGTGKTHHTINASLAILDPGFL